MYDTVPFGVHPTRKKFIRIVVFVITPRCNHSTWMIATEDRLDASINDCWGMGDGRFKMLKQIHVITNVITNLDM